MGKFGIDFLFGLITIGATISMAIALMIAGLRGREFEGRMFVPFVAAAPLLLMSVMAAFYWGSRILGRRQ
jgi:hypothetical protein